MNYPQKALSPTTLKVHLIGIGGIGISALARWFLAQNWAISGSDLAASQTTADLKKEGINVKIGHKPGNLPKLADLVTYSPAIPPQNLELRLARRLGIPALSYPEALGRLTKTYTTIAVAGSHGKSTTTALIGLALAKAGKDPTVVMGAKLKEFGDKNFRSGGGDILVVEADEWQASFLEHSPTIAVITNIDREHLDYYKNLAHLKKTFLMFLKRTLETGALVLNRDDKNLYSLRPAIQKIARTKKLKTVWYSLKRPAAKKIAGIIKIPGKHNISNALAALAVAKLLKIKEGVALQSLSTYRGAWRRMEFRGIARIGSLRADVFDDYAHHPTEIKATLKAFREKYPGRKLMCVYQPHQAKRLAALFKEFKTAFDDADITLILPTYEVAGRDIHRTKLDSEALVRAIQKEQPKKMIFYLKNPRNLKKVLRALLRPKRSGQPPLVVMMGAGDIVNYTRLLVGYQKARR